MSYLKLAENLFLGKNELNRLIKFLDTDGFRNFLLNSSTKFGLIYNDSINDFPSGRIVTGTSVTPSPTIKSKEIKAIDSNGNFIYRDETDNISLPQNNIWYWIRISFQYSIIEKGTVSINTAGVLTGTNTEFLKVLRGQPNFPISIQFSNNSLNTSKYTVLEILSNNSALLQGNFQNENNINYNIVGTFTPGYSPSSGEINPYQYDSCVFELIEETSTDTPPATETSTQFYLARVKRDGSNLEIQDKRIALWQTKADFFTKKIERTIQNPLIGIESIKYDNNFSSKEKNIIYLGWGFSSSNFTINSISNSITLNSGYGGIYKSTTDFLDGAFDGWRIYSSDGSYDKIKTSSKSGTQINIFLDTLNVAKISVNTELIIVPDVEEIEFIFNSWSNLKNAKIGNSSFGIEWQNGNTIRYYYDVSSVNPDLASLNIGDLITFTLATNAINNGTFIITAINNTDKWIEITNTGISDASKNEPSTTSCISNPISTEIPTQKFSFPINLRYGKCPLLVYGNPLCYYNIQYNYKHIDDYSPIWFLPNDTNNGYYNENQFNSSGELIASPTRTIYLSNLFQGFIPLLLNPNAYKKFNLGDLLGVEELVVSDSSPNVSLTVGQNKQYQLISGSKTLTIDWNVILNKTNVLDGNRFSIHFLCSLDLGGKNFKIKNYDGSILYTITSDFQNYLNNSIIVNNSGIKLDFIWNANGDTWIINLNDEPDTLESKRLKKNYNTDNILISANATTTLFTITPSLNKSSQQMTFLFNCWINTNSPGVDTGSAIFTLWVNGIQVKSVANLIVNDGSSKIITLIWCGSYIAGQVILVKASPQSFGAGVNMTVQEADLIIEANDCIIF